MPRTPCIAATLLLVLAAAAPPAAARPPSNQSRSGPVSPDKTLEVSWRLAPFTCHQMELTSKAPLRVTMLDGKVLRKLQGEGAPIVRRLCSGSNALAIRLQIKATTPATATATLTPVKLDAPPRKQDPRRDAWDLASRMYQTPYPAGHLKTLLGPAARHLGRGRPPLTASVDLAAGSCYRVQVRGEGQVKLHLLVSDPSHIPLHSQPLSPRELSPLTSDKICPRRAGTHHLVLAAAPAEPLATAWRLVGP